MKTSYVLIYNRYFNCLNYSGDKDPTASLLKLSGDPIDTIVELGKMVIIDNVVVKAINKRMYPFDVGHILTQEEFLKIEELYDKTTSKHIDTFEKAFNGLKEELIKIIHS